MTPKRNKNADVEIERDGITATVKESSLAAYARHGWTRVEDGTSETDPETGADDHQGGGFLSGLLPHKNEE